MARGDARLDVAGAGWARGALATGGKRALFFLVFCASKPVGFSRWRCARMDFVLPLIFEFALSSMATLRGRSHQSRLWGRVSLILEHVSTHGKPCREGTNIT